MAERLSCPVCGKNYSAAQIFDNCTVAWVGRDWIYFDCPACKDGAYIELGIDSVAIGELDGFPGPNFFAVSSIKVPNLLITKNSKGISLEFQGQRWLVPAK